MNNVLEVDYGFRLAVEGSIFSVTKFLKNIFLMFGLEPFQNFQLLRRLKRGELLGQEGGLEFPIGNFFKI